MNQLQNYEAMPTREKIAKPRNGKAPAMRNETTPAWAKKRSKEGQRVRKVNFYLNDD